MKDKTGNEPQPEAQSPPRARKSPYIKQILLGVIIFLCGLFIGSGMTILITRRMIFKTFRNPESLPQRITLRMKRNLDLTDTQAQQVRQIISRHIRELFQIRNETQPRVRKHLEQLKEEVADVLDEKQEQKWRQRFEKLERLFPPDSSVSEKENP